MGDLYGSDHFPIRVSTPNETPRQPRRYNISRADWKKYGDCVYSPGEVEQMPLEERFERLMTHVITTADQTIPKTNPNIKKPVPWWTAECDLLRQERKRALRRYQKTGLLVDRISYKRERAKAQFLMNKIKRKSWHDYISKITVDTPMSKVWRRIRKISRKYPTTHPPCLRIGASIVSDPGEVCEIMARHYSKVSSNQSYTKQFNRDRPRLEEEFNFETNIEEEYNAPITMKELESVLSEVRDSAPGEDLVTYSMIGNLHKTALSELREVMNELWIGGTFVDSWRKSLLYCHF